MGEVCFCEGFVEGWRGWEGRFEWGLLVCHCCYTVEWSVDRKSRQMELPRWSSRFKLLDLWSRDGPRRLRSKSKFCWRATVIHQLNSPHSPIDSNTRQCHPSPPDHQNASASPPNPPHNGHADPASEEPSPQPPPNSKNHPAKRKQPTSASKPSPPPSKNPKSATSSPPSPPTTTP